jgi:hypothetical protein
VIVAVKIERAKGEQRERVEERQREFAPPQGSASFFRRRGGSWFVRVV